MAMTQRDWIQELEDAEHVNSVEMQAFVKEMRGKSKFTPLEVAGILGYGSDAEAVFRLCEEGKIGYLARPTEKGERRSYVIPRVSLLLFLKEHCNAI